MAKYPCRNCVYFKECGENMRTMPCKGRTTKSERKEQNNEDQRNTVTTQKRF